MNSGEQEEAEIRRRSEAMASSHTQLGKPWHPAVRRTEQTVEDGTRVWLQDQPGDEGDDQTG
jgi:hypothetical protein